MTTNLTSTLRYAVIAILACLSTSNAWAELSQVNSLSFENNKFYYIQNVSTGTYLALQYDYDETNVINATPLVSLDDAYVFNITEKDGKYKIYDGDCYIGFSTWTEDTNYQNFNTAISEEPTYWEIAFDAEKGFTIKSEKGYLKYDGTNAYAYTNGTESDAIYWNIYCETDYELASALTLGGDFAGFDFSMLGETFDVTLTNPLSGEGHKNAVCLPFKMTPSQVRETFGDDTKVYELDRITNGYLIYKVRKDMRAGVPYMLAPSCASGDSFTVKSLTRDDFNFEPTSEEFSGYDLISTYEKVTVSDFYNYNDGVLTHYTGTKELPAFSSYLKSQDSSENSSTRLAEAVEFEDETDGISSVSFQYSDNTPIYNVKGQVVRQTSESFDGLTPGIYVVNGKKIVVK